MVTQMFPDDPILVSLLRACHREGDPAPMIHDVMGFSKDHSHLLSDVFATRKLLLQALPETILVEAGLLNVESPYIFLFCQSGYEYLVGSFAIRAIGGAVMPLPPGILPEEAQYFQNRTSASCILFGKGCRSKVEELRAAIVSAKEPTPFTSCPISTDAEPLVPGDISIDRSQHLAPRGPGIVFLTSGTTGPPKLAVLPRSCLAVAAERSLPAPGGAGLSTRPGHWIGGADQMLEPVLTGQSLYCLSRAAGAAGVLQAFVDHRITTAMFGTLLLSRMRDLILEAAATAIATTTTTTGDGGGGGGGYNGDLLSDEVRAKYRDVFRGLSSIRAGGSTTDPDVRRFWTDLTGLPFENFYASTEAGLRACSAVAGDDCCIGVPVDGVEMKLSGEPAGELCLRSAAMFTHYIGDEEATRAAFDQEGFLKSGDLAKCHNGQYYFIGRDNLDCVSYNHFHFSTLAVERALVALPGVSEACVVGVTVRARSQLCGAVIRLTATAAAAAAAAASIACACEGSNPHGAAPDESPWSLHGIRRSLQEAGALTMYMLPVLLRVLGEGEALPQTHTGKVAKGAVLQAFFGARGVVQSTACLPTEVQVWPVLPSADEMGTARTGNGAVKAWDWGGLQGA